MMRIWTVRPRWHAGLSVAWSAWLVGVEITADDDWSGATVYGAHLHIGPLCLHLSHQTPAP